MTTSTKNSLIGRITDCIGFNAKYHQYEPIELESEATIVSPVEAKVAHIGRINKGRIISKRDREVNLKDLVGDYARQFSEGSYINFYLSPFNKHFWVTPCRGSFVYTQKNEGKSWLPVFTGLENLFGVEVFDRAVKRNASIGSIFQTDKFSIAMIAVGSLNVNRVCMDYEEKRQYDQGVPCGYFSIGSSMLLCFPSLQDFLIKEGDLVKIGQGIVK